jgi:hypothetical protein
MLARTWGRGNRHVWFFTRMGLRVLIDRFRIPLKHLPRPNLALNVTKTACVPAGVGPGILYSTGLIPVKIGR